MLYKTTMTAYFDVPKGHLYDTGFETTRYGYNSDNARRNALQTLIDLMVEEDLTLDHFETDTVEVKV